MTRDINQTNPRLTDPTAIADMHAILRARNIEDAARRAGAWPQDPLDEIARWHPALAGVAWGVLWVLWGAILAGIFAVIHGVLP